MSFARRYRVAMLAAFVGVAAGMVSWLGDSSGGTAAITPPLPGQQIESGTIRHVVDRPGVGTAFVVDRLGSDRLSVTIHGIDMTAPTEGEVANPAISESGTIAWAEDQTSIKVWNPRTNELSTLNRPASTSAVFSPTFVSNRKLAAVGQQPVSGVPGEDDGMNNLFEIDLQEGAWRPLTTFVGTSTDWTALRTPVTTSNGDVLFVRVHGDSQATTEPVFELWTTSGLGAHRQAKLPGEMYLAGLSGDNLMWNALSETCDDWGLFEGTPDGLEQVGCGAVLADPLGAVDPDLQPKKSADFNAPPARGDLAVIVGDFPSENRAAEVEARLSRAPGQRVVTHDLLPHAVAPGAWVVVRPVPSGMSADDALNDIREELPAFAEMSFVISVGTSE